MYRRILTAFLLLLLVSCAGLVLGVGQSVTADSSAPDLEVTPGAGPGAPEGSAGSDQALPTLPRGGVSCQSLQPAITRGGFTDPVFVMSDAEMKRGSSGGRFCVYWDLLSESYSIYPINQPNAGAWRTTKAEFLPLLEDAGVNPCQIGFFSPVTNAILKETHYNDWHDVGKSCEVEYFAHGPVAERRIGEVKTALELARGKAEELFGWQGNWPLRVFLYDDQLAFSEGSRADGRAGNPPSANSKTAGLTLFNSAFMTVITIDLKRMEQQDLLSWMATSLYFHVVTGGVIGSPWFLPEFVAHGGADYFAMQTLGESHPAFPIMFRLAVEEAFSGRASPLSRHVKAAKGTNDGYLRGFVAMRYLAERWGGNAWQDLMWQNVNGDANRYLFNFSRLTGLTVDEFDRDMNDWLRGFGSLLPAPTPRPTPRPAATPRPNPTPRSATNPPATPPSPPPGPPTPP